MKSLYSLHSLSEVIERAQVEQCHKKKTAPLGVVCVEDIESLLAHCLRRETLSVGTLQVKNPKHLLRLCGRNTPTD